MPMPENPNQFDPPQPDKLPEQKVDLNQNIPPHEGLTGFMPAIEDAQLENDTTKQNLSAAEDTPVSPANVIPEGTQGTATILVTEDKSLQSIIDKSGIRGDHPLAPGLRSLDRKQNSPASDMGKRLREDNDK